MPATIPDPTLYLQGDIQFRPSEVEPPPSDWMKPMFPDELREMVAFYEEGRLFLQVALAPWAGGCTR